MRNENTNLKTTDAETTWAILRMGTVGRYRVVKLASNMKKATNEVLVMTRTTREKADATARRLNDSRKDR